MKNQVTLSVALLAMILAVLPPASAAIEAFLKIKGVDGESMLIPVRLIEPKRFSGLAALAQRRGGGVLVLQAKKGQLSALFGKRFAQIDLLEGDSAGRKGHYELENVLITAYHGSGASQSDKPVETVTFNFGKILWEYTPIER